jgi:phosphate transport system protein
MTLHLHRALESLKAEMLRLSSMVEESLFKAVRSIQSRNALLAQEVIDGDRIIDLKEVEVEEECLKILALHQPVAIDLRFIVAVLKINNDLERIGDLAVNIASRAVGLSRITTPPKVHVALDEALERVQTMLRRALEALVHLDESAARSVMAEDDVVDEMNRTAHKQVIEAIKTHPTDAERLVMLLSVSKNLERIADHTTNIAEDVIYMIGGEIVRHATRG